MLKSIQSGDASDYETLNDSEAWEAFLNGDCDAFQYLFRTYYDDLYHYAVKFSGEPAVAEDHIQRLFLKLWRRRDQLDKVEGVKTYLWTALRRSIIDTLRRKKTEEKYLNKLKDNRDGMQFTAEELIIRHEMDTMQSRELKEAMHQLTPKEREVLYLKFYEGMSYEEIEQIMSVSYQTSRNYVYRALQSLKAILSSELAFGLLFMGLLSV